jgi:hypothetical protein
LETSLSAPFKKGQHPLNKNSLLAEKTVYIHINGMVFALIY